ncbi:nuclear transport factor 2 [Histoplasma mississippiense (nom. inval.)]|uniref:nuclear transport factor 2 n=1 Tax=Ajellomyces capsulatus (strain NAm1 / WU24) TaxID=2059318 RepID=UPI000157B355|nr:nuclear transport factor 2 [Histoplasma mississippiense (nom. inval.)]EDN02267.1 nuclear transport factor 2 [Histoplasma mississippiense (nom. inval.)]
MAEQFVKFYYDTFDGKGPTEPKGREALRGLYHDESMLTFETSCVKGTSAIMDQLLGLPFQKVEHVQSTIDAQPTAEGGVVVLVTGALMWNVEVLKDELETTGNGASTIAAFLNTWVGQPNAKMRYSNGRKVLASQSRNSNRLTLTTFPPDYSIIVMELSSQPNTSILFQ